MAYTYYNPFNTALSSAEMYENARYIAWYLLSKNSGWTLNSICGMLGNWQSESTINPNRVETSQKDRWDNWGNYGFGLAQWTPWYTKQNEKTGEWYDPANYHGTNNPTYGYWAIQNGYTTNTTSGGTIGKMEPQLDYMNIGYGGYKTTSTFPMSFAEFKASTWEASELAKVYYVNYERSKAGQYGNRPANAANWWDKLVDEFGGGVTPRPPQKDKRRNFLMLAYGAGLIGKQR